MSNIVDEWLYWLYPEEVKPVIPQIEKLMIAGMKNIIRDVDIGVESSCMLHWDKGATVYADVKWTEDGLPLLEEPHYVKEVKGLA